MIHGCLLKAIDKSCIIPRVSLTTNFLERMRGLLFSPPLNKNEGLLIRPCRSVHTIGMSYAIDLVFLDHNWVVVKTVSELKPWRTTSCPKAIMVLELIADSIKYLGLSDGQQLEWCDDSKI